MNNEELQAEKDSLGCFICAQDNIWNDWVKIPRGMVKKSVWRKAGFQPTDIVCQECVERRIGRPLTAKDATSTQLAISASCRYFNDKIILMGAGDWRRYASTMQSKQGGV